MVVVAVGEEALVWVRVGGGQQLCTPSTQTGS